MSRVSMIIRLDESDKKKLERIAKKERRSVNGYVSLLIEKDIASRKTKRVRKCE